jgi:hypothetical protein
VVTRTFLAAAALAALVACGSTVQSASRPSSGVGGSDLDGAATAAGASDAAANVRGGSSAGPGAAGTARRNTVPVAVGGQPTSKAAAQTSGPIEVGFLNQTFAQAAQFGINTPAGHSTQETYTAVINAMNKSGGVNGRRIVPVFSNVNLTGNWSADYQAACSAFTEDHHVVAVLGYSLLLNDAFEACLTKRGVVHLSAGSPNGDDALLAKNPYLFMTAYPSADGVYLSTLNGAFGAGVITKASKLGVLRFDCDWDKRAWARVGKPFVDGHGLNVVRTEMLSCPTSATDVVARNQNQINSAVLQFNAAGVDTVIANGTAQYFAKTADQQRYFPKYVINTVDTSQGLQTQNVPEDQMKNMFGVGWYPILDTDSAHRPPMPRGQADAQARCLALAKSEGYVPTDADYQQLFTTCDTLFLYEAALKGTGGRATPVDVARAVLGLPYNSITALDGALAFSPTRHDGPNAWRPFKWETPCSCFVYTSGSQPMPPR